MHKEYSKRARELKREIKIFNEVSTLGIDERTIRWLRGHDEVPGTLQIIQYRKGRELNTTTPCFIKAHAIIKKFPGVFEKI